MDERLIGKEISYSDFCGEKLYGKIGFVENDPRLPDGVVWIYIISNEESENIYALQLNNQQFLRYSNLRVSNEVTLI